MPGQTALVLGVAFVVFQRIDQRAAIKQVAEREDGTAIYMRARQRLAGGQLDEAIEDFDICLRLDPAHALSLEGRGFAWMGKKDFDRAIRD